MAEPTLFSGVNVPGARVGASRAVVSWFSSALIHSSYKAIGSGCYGNGSRPIALAVVWKPVHALQSEQMFYRHDEGQMLWRLLTMVRHGLLAEQEQLMHKGLMAI